MLPPDLPSFAAPRRDAPRAKSWPISATCSIGRLSIAQGKQSWKNSQPLPWDAETDRFFAALQNFDDYLASAEPLHVPAEKLFQGPVADALTHVGQIAMMRRMAGGPIKGENYFVADIVSGCVGPQQAAPKREFD